MLRFLCALVICFPMGAQAGLLDLLPLSRLERKMIYPLSPVEVAPDAVGLPNTRVHRTDDGVVVWSVPAIGTSQATVLYFHGNAGNLANRAERFKLMQRQGFSVVAMSYRGSSGSVGYPSEDAIISDAQHVFETLHMFAPKTKSHEVILYGESLGSAVAIALLATLSIDQRPAGVVLEAPFTSIPEMARAVADVPPSLIARISDRWESLARAQALTIPTLVLHGTADEVTPLAMGRAIFKAAPTTDKDFIAARNASHSGTWRSDTMPRLWRFLRTYGAP